MGTRSVVSIWPPLVQLITEQDELAKHGRKRGFWAQEIWDAVIKSGRKQGTVACYDKLAKVLASKTEEEN